MQIFSIDAQGKRVDEEDNQVIRSTTTDDVTQPLNIYSVEFNGQRHEFGSVTEVYAWAERHGMVR